MIQRQPCLDFQPCWLLLASVREAGTLPLNELLTAHQPCSKASSAPVTWIFIMNGLCEEGDGFGQAALHERVDTWAFSFLPSLPPSYPQVY